MKNQLTAIIRQEEDAYVALCPEHDIASQGDTIESARGNLHRRSSSLFRYLHQVMKSNYGSHN